MKFLIRIHQLIKFASIIILFNKEPKKRKKKEALNNTTKVIPVWAEVRSSLVEVEWQTQQRWAERGNTQPTERWRVKGQTLIRCRNEETVPIITLWHQRRLWKRVQLKRVTWPVLTDVNPGEGAGWGTEGGPVIGWGGLFISRGSAWGGSWACLPNWREHTALKTDRRGSRNWTKIQNQRVR